MNRQLSKIVTALFLMATGSSEAGVVVGTVSYHGGPYSGDTGEIETVYPVAGAIVVLKDTPFFAFTDAQGRYVIEDAPRGAYDCLMAHPDYEGGVNGLVVSTDTTRRDGILIPKFEPQGSCWEPIVKFSGKVMDAGTNSPISGAYLMTGPFNYNCGEHSTWTGREGRYEWQLGLEPDTVRIYAEGYQVFTTVVGTYPPDPGVFTHRRDFQLAPLGKADIAAQIPEEPESENRLLPDGHVLRGFSLANHADSLLPGQQFGIIEVSVADSLYNSTLAYAFIWVNELNQGARTGINGRFIIGPVPPGTYTIRGLKNEYFDAYGDRPMSVTVPTRQPGQPPPVVRTTIWMYVQP